MTTEILKSSNLPQMSISAFVDMELELLAGAVRKKIPVSTLPSVYLQGPMGVGKSHGVQQLAERLEAETGKRVTLTDIRLLRFSPVDLRGIPTVNAERTASQWLIPDIFRLDPSGDVINIIFLDELSSCTPAVQAAAYQIVLDHRIGEHTLPANTYVIAAGNRLIDKSVVYKMPKALANRLTHFEITADADEWCDWAVRSGIDHRVTGFIRFKNDMLMAAEDSADELAFPTPRSWAMVSNYLNALGGDEEKAYSYICGCVGTGAALLFSSYRKVYAFLPNIRDIFSGKPVTLKKKTPDIYHALTGSMIAYVREHRTSFGEIETSLVFADRFLPSDFTAYLIHGYLTIDEELAAAVRQMQAFKDIARKKGSALNGFV